MQFRYMVELKGRSFSVKFQELGGPFSKGLGGVFNQIHSVHLCATLLKKENIPDTSIVYPNSRLC